MNLVLFDIDGTLTNSGQIIQKDMIRIIEQLASTGNYVLGLVGGGTYEKIRFQIDNAISYFKYIFAECGSVIYIKPDNSKKDNIQINLNNSGFHSSDNANDQELVLKKNMLDYCDRIILNDIIKTALIMIADMPIIYHGNQIDFRNGLVYISPPGMQATEYERNIFIEQDNKHNLRKKLLSALKLLNINNSFEIALGGNIGIAIYPKGWNKGQVIDYITENTLLLFNKIYYFGDRTEPDGNDYPIYSHPLINGFSVKKYQDTIDLIEKYFLTK